VIDRHIYAGERYSLTARDRRGVREIREQGGADLLAHLLGALLAADAQLSGSDTSPWAVHLGVEPPPLDAASSGQDGYALWEPHKPRRDAADDTPRVWRASRLMGYGHFAPAVADGPSAPQVCPVPDPDLLVLDDAGFMFRHAAARPIASLAERLTDKDGFILLKMSEPVAQGELWHMLAARFADRLVCLVAARDLRREKLGLGRGLSWEATLADLRLTLDTNAAATNLLGCRHLIVTFSSDGALWLE
jgi:hypothetical protein